MREDQETHAPMLHKTDHPTPLVGTLERGLGHAQARLFSLLHGMLIRNLFVFWPLALTPRSRRADTRSPNRRPYARNALPRADQLVSSANVNTRPPTTFQEP